MVKLTLLDENAPYRVVPPLIAPETANNVKKGRAFIILAPSIESELSYLYKSTCPIKFRHLYKYFIDKKFQLTLYGKGRQIIEPNSDGHITELISHHKTYNLSKVDGVTSYLRVNKQRPLKDLNVLYEVNHLYPLIMDNEKDRRLVAYKANDYIKALNELIEVGFGENNILSTKGYIVDMIIPMNLWFTQDMFTSPATITKSATKIPGGRILQNVLGSKVIEKRVNRLYLVFNNVVMPINLKSDTFKDLTPDQRYEALIKLLTQFMTKARTSKAAPDPTDKHDMKAVEAQKASEIEEAGEDTLKAAKIDPDTVSQKTKEEIGKKAVESGVKKVATPVVKPAEEIKIPGDASKNTPEVNQIDSDLEKLENIEAIEVPKVKAGDEVADLMLAAKLEGQSIQSYKRNEELKKKYTTLKLGDVTLDKLVEDEQQYDIPVQETYANVVNEDMKEIKASRFDEAYNKNLMEKDLANILLHFSHVKPALYLNKDIQITDISTPTDRILKYTVEFEDENRKRHRFSFQLPKMYQEKYMYLNDQKMNLLHQKFPFPVTKVSPSRCQAVTNYKKIFTERYGTNLSPRVTRLIKTLLSPNCPNVVRVVRGDATSINRQWMTSMEFDEIASNITRIDIGKSGSVVNLYFSIMEAAAVINPDMAPKPKDEKYDLIPLGRIKSNNNTTLYFISGTTNKVYDDTGKDCGELTEFIIGTIIAYAPSTESVFSGVSIGTKFVYSRSRVMAEWIPTIIVLAAADPGGLSAVLEKAQIEYQFVNKRSDIEKTENPDDMGVIQFEDGYLAFKRYPFENSLLMNGLMMFPSKEYSFYDMNTRDAYVEIFNDMFGKRNLVDALQNFYYMFIDPITMDVLIRLKMPTDFTRLMLYCNDVLADNTFQLDSDYHNTRIRSNEIILAHLYVFLSEAWGNWRTGRLEKFSIREDAVIKELMKSNIVDPHSELNLMLETENDRQIKLKGPSGMNEERSFTLEKRAYHESMKGIIGMNTAPSGEVGINRHLVLNPNITDARGFVKVDTSDDHPGSELATPAELMQVFGPEAADNERLLMSISQSKHVVPVESDVACPISYDMERVMPYLSNDFSHVAKMDGQVVEIANDVMIIKYKDGTFDDVDLSERPAKNTDGGFYIMNQMSTDLKVGNRVKAGQIVAYDKKYINGTSDMFGDPLAVMGTMARVAVETNGGVYEDACYITDKLAHRLETKITRQKRVILSRFANIKYIAKVGQQLKANDPILIFDDTEDEFSSQILAQMAEEAEDEDEIIASSAPVISKYSGVVKDIRIYYTIPTEQMTTSMKKIVSDYNKEANKREKTISKYKNIYDANTIVKTSEQLTPDSEGKVKGVRVNDGIFIDFYIEYPDVAAPGDKISYFSAMKGIISDIIPAGLEPYGNDPDHKIDACVSSIGFYRRMCLDFAKVGGLCKMSIERKKRLKRDYLEKCKAELKK